MLRYFMILSVLIFAAGCGAQARLGLAKTDELGKLQERVSALEQEADDAANFDEEFAGKLEVVDLRTKQNTSAIGELERTVQQKVSVADFQSKLDAWAGGSNPVVRQQAVAEFAQQTRGQLGAVTQQLNNVAGQVSGKMDRFGVYPVKASQVLPGCSISEVHDRQNQAWYCWRWNNSNPRATTVLLIYAKQQWCQGPQWLVMAPEGMRGMLQEGIPVPPHVQSGSGPTPLGGTEPPPSPGPST